MDPKNFISWIADFVRENRVLSSSMVVLLLGSVPLYIYSLSIGQLPDFSLADFTGILIASFLTELVIAVTMVAYMLFAGFATRKVVNEFYPSSDHRSPPSENSDASVEYNTHDYLIKGRFIVGVTIFSLLVWFGLATKTFNVWLAPQYPGLANWVYMISLVAAGLLVLVDWRRGLRVEKYILFAILAGSTVFLTILAAAYLSGLVVESPPESNLPIPSPSVSLRDLGAWTTDTSSQLMRGNLVATAFVVAAIAAASALIAASVTRERRSAIKRGEAPQPFFKNEVLKLLTAKVCATAVFAFCSILVVLFFAIVVDTGSLHDQTLTALAGGSYLIVLNWIAFSARDWKLRVILGFATFITVFVAIPIENNNATLFPKMVVKALGVGNLHASSIALSSLQCATLAPYGVECVPTKDVGIGITNVNILNRLGSTVIIELQVRRSATANAATAQPSAGSNESKPATKLSEPAEFKTLTMLAAPTDEQMEKQVSAMYPCDRLLIEKLRVVDPKKADALACVRLSVPKEQLLGNTTNGAATYQGDFSQYVRGPSALKAQRS